MLVVMRQDATEEQIRGVMRAIEVCAGEGLDFFLSAVVTRESAGEIDWLLATARRFGVSVNFQILQSNEEMYGSGAAAHLPEKVPPAERLSEADLVSGIRSRGTAADFVPRVDDIVSRLIEEVRAGDRVVILSNGGFGGLHDKLLAALKTRGAGL